MANKTLFYKVSADKINAFKSAQNRAENPLDGIGFVSPVTALGSDFGYIIGANGQQYGPTPAQIADIASAYAGAPQISDNSEKLTIDGSEYSLTIVDGKLSLSKFTAAKWSSFAFSNYTVVEKKNVAYEFGASYSVSISINGGNEISYTLTPGTETVSARSVSITRGSFTTSETLSTNSGKISLSGNFTQQAVSATYSGTVTYTGAGTQELGYVKTSNVASATASATTSANTNPTNSSSLPITTAYASINIQTRVIIAKTAAGITTKDSGLYTLHLSDPFIGSSTDSKSQITFAIGDYGFVAVPTSTTSGSKRNWAISSWVDKSSGDDYSKCWKNAGSLSVYGTNDYTIYKFVDTVTNEATTFGAPITFIVK